MMRRRLLGLIGDDRGVALIVVALGLTAFLGVTALALDLGMLYTARTESQRVADAAALAGAGRLLSAPNDEDGARQEAIDYAEMHSIRGQTPQVLSEDVEVFLGPQRVRVTVRNTQARGNPFPTYFARILGFDEADVVTVAMAEVADAGPAEPVCDLPLSFPDKWIDDGNQKWDGEPPDDYLGDNTDPSTFPNWADGEKIELKMQPAQHAGGKGPPGCEDNPALWDPCQAYEDASWRCWWLPYPEPQDLERNADLRRRIAGECPDDDPNDGWAYETPGNIQSLAEDLAAYIDEHSDEAWNPHFKCAVGVGDELNTTDEGVCLENPQRVRTVPLFHPDGVQGSGNNRQAEILGRVGFYMDKVSCGENAAHREGPAGQWNLYGYFTATQFGAGGTGPVTSEPTVKVLRLIE